VTVFESTNAKRFTLSRESPKRTLQHAATHCYMLQRAATRCNTLQHAATRCYTLQHTLGTATLQHTLGVATQGVAFLSLQHIVMHCNTLQHTATHCITHLALQRCNTLQHTATHCNTLQHTATQDPNPCVLPSYYFFLSLSGLFSFSPTNPSF